MFRNLWYERNEIVWRRGGETCSTEESLEENQKHQRAAKSVCNVKDSSLNNASLT